MNDHAAFEATFSDWKLIRSRKVVQLVFEVPVETSHLAYKVLDGMPNPAAEVWVAVARLDLKTIRQQQERADESALNSGDNSTQRQPASVTGEPPARARNYTARIWANMRDIRFQKWMADRYGISVGTDHAAAKGRELLEIASFSEVTAGSKAADRWDILESSYRTEFA